MKIELTEKQTENIGTNKKTLFNQGFNAGFQAAAQDYAVGNVNLELFDIRRDFSDIYEIGFEIGYNRKLAEIAIY